MEGTELTSGICSSTTAIPVLSKRSRAVLRPKEETCDQATWDRYNAITAEKERKKAAEIENRREYYRQKAHREFAAREEKAKQVAARGTTYATIASAPVAASTTASVTAVATPAKSPKRLVAKPDAGSITISNKADSPPAQVAWAGTSYSAIASRAQIVVVDEGKSKADEATSKLKY